MQTTNFASYYESLKINGDQFAIAEALQALNSQIDFSQYDANNDGRIDSVIFVYSKDYDYDVAPCWPWIFSGQYGKASSIGILDNKTFDLSGLSGYSWHQGGQIALSISVASMITNNATNVTLNITVS